MQIFYAQQGFCLQVYAWSLIVLYLHSWKFMACVLMTFLRSALRIEVQILWLPSLSQPCKLLHKDVFGVDEGRVVGAHLNSSRKAAQLGVCTCGSPPEKRYGLSVISLHVAQLSHTSDSLHLCLLGGWTSALVYRRVLMGILQDSYKLVKSDEVDSQRPRRVPLTRKVAEELTLLAVLAPLACSELNAEYSNEIFCSDASMSHGAFCSAHVETRVAELLWRSQRTKGAYTRLQTPAELVLQRLGFQEETSPCPGEVFVSPQRPLALEFDFVEVFAGSGRVTAAAAEKGLLVCCPIDLSRSEELNVAWVHVASWLAFMITEKRVKSFMVEPPCTTFSIMRRPALRDAAHPFGFDVSDPQTADGNTLAHRGFQLLWIGLAEQVTGLLETPNASKMKNFPSWQNLERHPDADSCRTDSCAYGSIHLKSFRFLGVHADLRPLSKRCDGTHEHVQVQGKYTLGSAVYTPLLADALAEVMVEGVRQLNEKFKEMDAVKVQGLESQFVNEVALTSDWRVVSAWPHKKIDHINLFELHSVYKLALFLAAKRTSMRVVCLVDSIVTRCAVSKGRSSSCRLTTMLRKLAALCLCAGLYFTLPFVPTRLNASDDPTRGAPLRDKCPGLGLSDWSYGEIYKFSQMSKLRRWASNWMRLTLLLLGPAALDFSDRSVFRSSCRSCVPSQDGVSSEPGFARPNLDFGLDFDATLGYPGEGPLDFPLFSTLFLFFSSLFFSANGRVCSCSLAFFSFAPALAMDDSGFLPRNAGDMSRATLRRQKPPLPAGRPVLPVTSENRERLLQQFFHWLRTLGIQPETIFSEPHEHLQLINDLLNRYGRCLYFGGRPYNHYAETINSVSAFRPSVRRSLQGAWDLAYAWVRDEKPTHHIAIPWQLLLAMLTVSLCWGWTSFAGGLALSFGALLRPGEFLHAKRRDLMLPADVGYTQQFALLSIPEPKTRFTVARHQCAKLDVPDMLDVVVLAFRKFLMDQPLWEMSNQTFRVRFRQILQCVGVGSALPGMAKVCDPGSLRAGGATWLLQSCEDFEFVRRRGRWATTKAMCVTFHAGEEKNLEHLICKFERQKLFLTVQIEVLPRYGYEGSSNGVYKMMGDMKPYIKDPQFIELADEINCLLGINYSPSESWESLSDNCQKLNEEKVGPGGRRGYPPELRPPMGLLGPVPSLLNGKPLRLPDFILGNP
eukprot:s4606_g6.t1